ncbi:HEAT repeat domain-containing protein [Leptolyngbya sp. FACHB-261]|uniref:HEAT repeat domain-containing protein n=1 Tax=Leptolyngbya sp. FACHB-261 TaxID=2692806 RepID=UPI0016899323|nr:HEAT repeat domain-containing protein [Leptolyngbya sp. FACHB-261]MBD2099544.1 HEAT repeat domain-containing protein [Leptolyngbya sp. FACHB-261]
MSKLLLTSPVLAQSSTPSTSGASKPTTPRIHVVVAGDTVEAIAVQYGVPQETIRRLNPGINPNRMSIGQQIKLPPLDAAAAAAAALPPQSTTIPAERSVSTPASTLGNSPAANTPAVDAPVEPTEATRPRPVVAEPAATAPTYPSPWLLGGGVLLAFLAGTAFSSLLGRRREETPLPQRTAVNSLSSPSVASSTHKTDGSWVSTTPPGTVAEEYTENPDGGSLVQSGNSVKMQRLDVVEELIGDLQSSDRQQRQRAIWDLGQKGDSRAVKPLVHLLMDSDSKHRSLILATLTEIGSSTVTPLHRALLVSLQDENPEVRMNAIRDLTRVFDLSQRAAHILNHVIDDPDPEVQETARWAASRLGVTQLMSLNSGGTTNPAALSGSAEPPRSENGTTHRREDTHADGEPVDRR